MALANIKMAPDSRAREQMAAYNVAEPRHSEEGAFVEPPYSPVPFAGFPTPQPDSEGGGDAVVLCSAFLQPLRSMDEAFRQAVLDGVAESTRERIRGYEDQHR
jgi:hypothetical protein